MKTQGNSTDHTYMGNHIKGRTKKTSKSMNSLKIYLYISHMIMKIDLLQAPHMDNSLKHTWHSFECLVFIFSTHHIIQTQLPNSILYQDLTTSKNAQNSNPCPIITVFPHPEW